MKIFIIIFVLILAMGSGILFYMAFKDIIERNSNFKKYAPKCVSTPKAIPSKAFSKILFGIALFIFAGYYAFILL